MKLTIIRDGQVPFTMVPNSVICSDPRLSWKAKGIYTYLLSRPHGWEMRLADLVNRSKDGRESTVAGLRELEDAGLITRVQARDEAGRMGSATITVRIPILNESNELSPQTGFPSTVKPITDNTTHSNTDLRKKDLRKKDQEPPYPPRGVCAEGDNPNPKQPPSFPKPPNPNPPVAPPPPFRSRLTVAQMQRFEQWYRQYPKKVSRGQAEKAWVTVERMNDVDVGGMIEKLEEQKASPDWLKEGGKYIPHPATYLNAKKWLDEADAPESSDDLFDNYVAAGLKAQFG